MDALIFLVVVVGLAAFVAQPLYGPRGRQPDTSRMELEARREAVMGALADLELDQASGLVAAEEYERQRGAMEAEAAEVLRRLSND